MKKQFYLLMGVVSLFLATGCQQKVDVEKEKAEISEMYDLHIQALLKGDVETIVSFIPEGYESIGVGEGKIVKTTKADTKQGFEEQFKKRRYIEINNLVTPTIKVSSDGKMAWGIWQMKFKYVQNDSIGVEHERMFTLACLSVFEKLNSKWVESAIAQTVDREK